MLDAWVSNIFVRELIKRKMSEFKPRTIIELGTFTGVGMEEMASHVQTYTNSIVKLYTIDAGINVKWDSETDSYIPSYVIDNWEQIAKERNERLNKKYPFCEIEYIQGITVDVLPNLMEQIKIWDFCFHDAHHLNHLQTRDFDLMKDYTSIGSFIIFDDTHGCFDREFPDHVKEFWETERFAVPGRNEGALLARRIK